MKINKLNISSPKILLAIATVVLIISISTFFHYQIYIGDALTLKQLQEFGINIPFLRILFEPVLGILLYFNRVLYSIDEILYTLHWSVLIFIFYTVTKSIRIKENKKYFITTQIMNFPLLVGIWFTLFVVIVFIPLPNNTIVNNSENYILVTTHSHTEYSHDGLTSQKGLWEWHKRNGFDAFFITDHNNHNRTIDFKNSQRDGEFPLEPLVLCGEEFSGTNHLSLLGLKRKFSTKSFADSTAIDSVHANNGAVIVNHWFDGKHKSLGYYKNIGVDGFEIENTATERFYDRNIYEEIKEFCENNNLIMNGGLDFHGYGNVCSIWNAFNIPKWKSFTPDKKEEAILKIIQNRDQSKLKILIYKDRPFYDSQYLYLSPLFTLFNYFRTLNVYQVLSWIIWILLFVVVKNKISNNPKLSQKFSINKLLPALTLASSLFLLTLGGIYFIRIKNINGFTEMYNEYSTILFYVGFTMLVYPAITLFVRRGIK